MWERLLSSTFYVHINFTYFESCLQAIFTIHISYDGTCRKRRYVITFPSVWWCVQPQTVRARARAGNRKIRIPPTGVGACISNAAENADCRCQRLGGPTANFRQAVFHKSRRSLRVPQRVKQLYRRFSHPYVSSSPLSLSQMWASLIAMRLQQLVYSNLT